MVVVIGGGATGLGVAWDLVLRSVPVVVVERGEIGFGTSGRFHGLLHSGGRYAVSDPSAAKECMGENEVLRRIAPSAIEASGGYFVRKQMDDKTYEEKWIDKCVEAGIPLREVSLERVRDELPALAHDVSSAYLLPDGVLEGFKLLNLLAHGITARGGQILERHQVTGVVMRNGRVEGVRVSGPDGSRDLGCDAIVNASGPWGGEVARIMGVTISMRLSYGLMIIFANRRIPYVVNRLKRPSDGDIFVPHQAVTILGTTDVPQDGPEAPVPSRADSRRLMEIGKELFPDLETWRVMRAFTGVRPLYQSGDFTQTSREVSRDFAILDHSLQGGPTGAFSILGGKWTTFRLMGERTADAVCSYLGVSAKSVSASTLVEDGTRPRRATVFPDPVICECESVKRSELGQVSGEFDKWRTRTWISMGPCQGTFCIHRAFAARSDLFPSLGDWLDAVRVARSERGKGMSPVLWGQNVRQLALQRSVRFQSLAEEWDDA